MKWKRCAGANFLSAGCHEAVKAAAAPPAPLASLASAESPASAPYGCRPLPPAAARCRCWCRCWCRCRATHRRRWRRRRWVARHPPTLRRFSRNRAGLPHLGNSQPGHRRNRRLRPQPWPKLDNPLERDELSSGQSASIMNDISSGGFTSVCVTMSSTKFFFPNWKMVETT